MKEKLREEYFEWLRHLIRVRGHDKLLRRLHETEFRYYIPMDGNRFEDGVNLRYQFADEKSHHYRFVSAWIDDRGCSILEMMVALAIRIEDQIMSDSEYGDRTHQWFMSMLKSMGIADMDDDHFNPAIVDLALSDMMDHNYQKNGAGGLFTLRKSRKDMRKVEIWCQAMWYLDDVLDVP